MSTEMSVTKRGEEVNPRQEESFQIPYSAAKACIAYALRHYTPHLYERQVPCMCPLEHGPHLHETQASGLCSFGVDVDTIHMPGMPPVHDCLIGLLDQGKRTQLILVARKPEYLSEIWEALKPHLPQARRQRTYGSTQDKVREAQKWMRPPHNLCKTKACERVHIDTRTYDRYADLYGGEENSLEVEG